MSMVYLLKSVYNTFRFIYVIGFYASSLIYHLSANNCVILFADEICQKSLLLEMLIEYLKNDCA